MNVKQVIVVRKDLKMRSGKIAAQVGHASMKSVLDSMTDTDTFKYIEVNNDTPMSVWLRGDFTKIVASVDSIEELLQLKLEADAHNIQTTLITDAGKTEFGGIPTITCVAIGPDINDKINHITGHLPLL